MKKYCILIVIFTGIIWFNSCKEESIGQFPIDNVAPKPVKNVIVENLAGGVKFTYEIPDEEDLLYVQAVYNLPNGTQNTVKTSVFSNSLTIKGFGKSQKSNVQLMAVDRSKNESDAINVEIKPLDSPIYSIWESLVLQESFGGFKVFWENPLKEDIVVDVLKKNVNTGELGYVENFYSSVASAREAVRGLDSTKAMFYVVVRDPYGNHTDTLVAELKPLFEQEIPKSGFVQQKLSSRFKVHSYGGANMDRLWDGITNVATNCYYIQTGNTIMPYYTFDMGVTAKLSRLRWWQRVDFLFALHNPKEFEFYGTNDPLLAADAETQGWETNPGWIKMISCISHKPSGDDNTTVTTEDQAYAYNGEEFEFPLEAPSVRFLRFKVLRTWSGSSGVHVGEFTFWGQIEE